jgi:linoleoyl-CoA desaturase
MKIQTIKFAKDHNEEFYKVLKQRVADYFKKSNISRHGNASMVFKTFAMLAFYFVPFTLICMDVFESKLLIFLMWCIMGFGMAGIGLSIMHDANHGAYSKHQWVNKLVGYVITLIGGHDVNWRIQHNVLHHTYTNIHGMDEDISPGPVMRFSPHAQRRAAHKYQHIYAWFLYGMMTVSWSTVKDFLQINRYKKLELLETQGTTYARSMTILILTKIGYYILTLGLPIMLNTHMSVLGMIGSYYMMHFICGVTLGAIFQPAHVVPSSPYPKPDESGNVEADWAVSQLYNTANFAPGGRLFSWYVGGLNFQVEHHLFPNICHVHYRKISEIVKSTAEEFKLPYYSQKTWAKALAVHGQMLYNLGHYDDAPALD